MSNHGAPEGGSPPTVVIAAGGTGGHLFPAAAFASAMRGRGWRVTLITDVRGRRYAEGFPADVVHDVSAATIQGVNPIRAASALARIFVGVRQAGKLLDEIPPKIVAGFGGYPALPALWAARARKLPFLIHEQNAVLGRVNRVFAADAQAVACGFDRLHRLPEKAKGRKIVIGNPVRAPILAVRERPYPPATAGAPVRLLVTGGSQGARILGELLPAAIGLLAPDLRARVRVEQQVREEQLIEVRSAYEAAGVAAECAPFFPDMADRLARAHLVIARAGASTVTELQVAGRPAILIPLAIAADDHQTANAKSMADVGAADVLSETEATPERLAGLLQARLSDGHGLATRAAAARSAARPEAAQDLADLAENLARG